MRTKKKNMHSNLDSMNGDRGGKEHKNHDKQMEIKKTFAIFCNNKKYENLEKTIDTNQHKGKNKPKTHFMKRKKNKKKSSLIVPLVQ